MVKKKTEVQEPAPGRELSTVPQNKMLSYQEVEQIGKAFVASGMFGRDIDRVSKAITKIMAGQELGMAPFAAMRAIHVIEGNATLSANTMAAMVKRSGHYDYEVLKKTAEGCEIAFYESRAGVRRKVGTETFDIEEARTAGLLNKNNWRNYPKAMMFARCMSNGVRTYCPDVFNGMLVYTPDEMGGKVDLSGDYAGAIDGEVIDEKPEAPSAEVKPEPEVAPEPDVEEVEEPEPSEPRAQVTEEWKAETLGLIDSLGLTSIGRTRFLKDCTGAIAPGSIKKDEQWHTLRDRIDRILNGEEGIDADGKIAPVETNEAEEGADDEPTDSES